MWMTNKLQILITRFYYYEDIYTHLRNQFSMIVSLLNNGNISINECECSRFLACAIKSSLDKKNKLIKYKCSVSLLHFH